MRNRGCKVGEERAQAGGSAPHSTFARLRVSGRCPPVSPASSHLPPHTCPSSPPFCLQSVQSFMGHGGGSAKGAGGGMSTKQQRAAMEQFRQPGRRLLVATAAAEEGIDVPHCEVVVRYSAVQTGA